MATVLRQMIRDSGRIVFLGGAGVSTESGIPDFRSDNSVKDAVKTYGYPPEVLLSHSFFLRHTDIFFDYYRASLLRTDVLPNAAHHALRRLELSGKLTAIVTQNIDGLHGKAGSVNVLELHGTIYKNRCMDCGKAYDVSYIQVAAGVPRCACGGIVKPEVVLYEEGLDPITLNEAMSKIARADMLIVGGTSLMVYPAAGLIEYYSGNKLVLINKSETPYDERADRCIHRSIGQVLSEAID